MIDLVLALVPALHGLIPAIVPLASDSDGGELAFLLAGPVGGAALYAAVYRYYRNADKTHQFERETLIALKDRITGEDQRVGTNNGTRESHIKGDNTRDFRRRVSRLE